MHTAYFYFQDAFQKMLSSPGTEHTAQIVFRENNTTKIEPMFYV